jgi:type I site-specific restriction endonuclease
MPISCPFNEADTRAKLIDPALHSRGWTENLIRREETAGAIDIVGETATKPFNIPNLAERIEAALASVK